MIAALLLSCLLRAADVDPALTQRWPLTLSAQVGSLGFSPGAANPQLSVGTEYALRRSAIHELALAANLGSVYFRENLAGGLLEAALSNRWTLAAGLYAELTVGAGYQLTVFPGTTYTARAGAFEVGGNVPTSMFRARLSVGLGVDLGAVRLSAQYWAFVLTPYAAGNGIPLVPGALGVVVLSVPLRGAS